MKKQVIIIISLLLILSLTTGCTGIKESSLGPNEDISDNNSEKEITIIMSKHNTINKDFRYTSVPITYWTQDDEMYNYSRMLIPAMREFEEKTGIKVKIEYTNAKDYEEYINLRNTQLYLDNGPALILISGGEDCQNLIKEGVALNISNRIPNYENIYDELKDDYYIPITMASNLFILNKKYLTEEMGLEEPSLDWNERFFHHMMDRYYDDKRSFITREAVYIFINSLFENGDLFLDGQGNLTLASKDIVEGIEKIRYEIMESGRFKREEPMTSGSYNLLEEPFYYEKFKWLMESTYSGLYEEYIDAVYPYIAEEYAKGKRPWFTTPYILNSMNSIVTNQLMDQYLEIENGERIYFGGEAQPVSNKDVLLLPQPYPYYLSWGFIVNRNGKYLDEGLDFINMLLSDEAQLDQYKGTPNRYDKKHLGDRKICLSTPVVKTLESELNKADIEANVLPYLTTLRKEILRQILEGERTRGYRGGSIRGAYPLNINRELTEDQEYFFKEELEKVIVKVVFADEKYTSESIMKELRELENRLNIMFSE